MDREDSMRLQFFRLPGLQHDALGSMEQALFCFPGGFQPQWCCASSKNTGFCSVQAGNHFRFARQKAVQKRHCLLLFSPIHVILAKIYFRNPRVLQQETALQVPVLPAKESKKRTSLLQVNKGRKNLSVLQR